MAEKKIITLEHGGFVRVEDVLGSDLTVVNAARVSFGDRSEKLTEKDEKLINYLVKHRHHSPLRHCIVQFHFKAQEFVARQLFKHIVGSDYAFKDTAWNEISLRYVKPQEELWCPTELRKQAPDKKQGSSNELVEDNVILVNECNEFNKQALAFYNKLLDKGVCREQARAFLPVSFFTEWYWTGSLQAIYHLVELRNKPDAQLETRQYAQAIDVLMSELFPVSWRALNETV